MGYIPKFEYDIFISYASANNKPLDEEKDKGWVTTTQKLLSNYLYTKCDQLSVWFDEKDITVGDDFEIVIKEGLEKSATLLIFLSKAYLRSPWCDMEHTTFLKKLSQYREHSKAGIPGHQRVFIARLESDLEEDEIPDELKGLHSKSFFREDDSTGVPLCWPNPLALDKGNDFTLYNETINLFGADISKQLKKLKIKMKQQPEKNRPWQQEAPEQTDTGGMRAFYQEKLQECDGLIIIYGEADESWVTTHLQRSYTVWKRGLREKLYAAGAIVETPPPEVQREMLSYTPGYMDEIDCKEGFDEAWMQDFLTTVKAAVEEQGQDNRRNPFPCVFVHALGGKDREFAKRIHQMARRENVEICIPKEGEF